jgi:hypothetical protein
MVARYFRPALAAAILPLALLSACARSGQDNADRGNRNIGRMNALADKAETEYHFNLLHEAREGDPAIDEMSMAKAREARQLVEEYISLGKEALEIAHRPDVRFSATDTLDRRLERADAALGALNRRIDAASAFVAEPGCEAAGKRGCRGDSKGDNKKERRAERSGRADG